MQCNSRGIVKSLRAIDHTQFAIANQMGRRKKTGKAKKNYSQARDSRLMAPMIPCQYDDDCTQHILNVKALIVCHKILREFFSLSRVLQRLMEIYWKPIFRSYIDSLNGSLTFLQSAFLFAQSSPFIGTFLLIFIHYRLNYILARAFMTLSLLPM